MTAAALLFAAALVAADPVAQKGVPAAQPLHVESVLLTLVEEVEVPAREAGVLAAVAVREGELVQQKQLLARIDDTEVQIALARARLEAGEAKRQAGNDVKVRVARKTLEVAEVELKRADEARERFSKSISQTELDERRLKTEKCRLELEQAEHDFETAAHLARVAANELSLAERNVQRRRIDAPLDGMVVKVYRRPGEWVEPGEVVLRMVRLDTLRAEGFLDARQASAAMTGRAVRLLVDLPPEPPSRKGADAPQASGGREPGQSGSDRNKSSAVEPGGRASAGGETSFPGRLVFISPEVDPINGQVRVWAEIENRGLRLRPGLKARLVVEK